MKAVVIYAHPDSDGHNQKILTDVKANLTEKSIEFEVIDLYKINYDPVLFGQDSYGEKNNKVNAQNENFQKIILASDVLIFIYPVWYHSMPAILHGFMCKTFTPGFAYEHKGLFPKGLLRKEAFVFMTLGAPLFYERLRGNVPQKLIRNALRFVGMKSRIYSIGACTKINAKKIKKIKKVVNKALSKL